MRSNKLISIFFLLFIFVGCKKPFGEDLEPQDINNSITVTVDTSGQVLADGNRLITVGYKLDSARAADYFTPTFSTEGGTQIGLNTDGKVFLVNDTATSYIRTSLTPGTYQLSVVLNGFPESKKDISIRTQRSLPETILVEADKTLADTVAGSFVDFSVFLQKQQGKVSKETSVYVKAYQLRGPALDTFVVGRFTGLVGNKSDENGKIVLKLFTDTKDFDNSKIVKVVFSSPNNNNGITRTVYSLPIK